jgi:DNA-binding MarR family transcriptional regulator
MEQRDLAPGDPGEEPDWQLLMGKLAEIEARLDTLPQPPPSEGLSDDKLAVLATSIYRARRRRLDYFDADLFAEPAWDMLLDLFVNKALGRRISTSSLCLAADAAQATGLRYIAILEAKGLVRRRPAPDDGRVTLVDLTTLGYKQMRRYVADGIARFDMPRLG